MIDVRLGSEVIIAKNKTAGVHVSMGFNGIYSLIITNDYLFELGTKVSTLQQFLIRDNDRAWNILKW